MSKIIEVIQNLILSISKERKALYNNLNNKLEDYSEEELIYLLDYENIKIDKDTKEMIYDRFKYLKYKYEKILPFINIYIDKDNLYEYSFAVIDKQTIVINPNQMYHISNYFKLPIQTAIETMIVYGVGKILDEDIDLDIINESKKIFIKNAKDTILYRIEKEAQAWDKGIEFVYDQNIKYRESIHRLFKYYSVGCYTLHYRNIVWCCISI